MRKIGSVLMCVILLAAGVLYLGLYAQYESAVKEKQAAERRAEVLKTLLTQTEQELAAEKERGQAERKQGQAAREKLKEGQGMTAAALPLGAAGQFSLTVGKIWQRLAAEGAQAITALFPSPAPAQPPAASPHRPLLPGRPSQLRQEAR